MVFLIRNACELIILIIYDTNKLIWYLVAEQVAQSVSVPNNFPPPAKKARSA